MKGELRFLVGSRPRLRDFFGVSSLSHGFARALPYSAMERRIEIFWVGSRPTLSEIFLIGSQPNDDIRALSLGGVLSPSIPGLASYLTSFSVPTGRDVIVKSVS